MKIAKILNNFKDFLKEREFFYKNVLFITDSFFQIFNLIIFASAELNVRQDSFCAAHT